jgi:hypothetical protein
VLSQSIRSAGEPARLRGLHPAFHLSGKP